VDGEYRGLADEYEDLLRAERRRKAFAGARSEEEAEYLRRGHQQLGGVLYRARMRAHLSQEDLGMLMGTTASAISRMECGRRSSPSVTTLLKFAEACDCRLEIKLRSRERGTDDC
jgi:DNA-binding XRE family transcriptional regulator